MHAPFIFWKKLIQPGLDRYQSGVWKCWVQKGSALLDTNFGWSMRPSQPNGAMPSDSDMKTGFWRRPGLHRSFVDWQERPNHNSQCWENGQRQWATHEPGKRLGQYGAWLGSGKHHDAAVMHWRDGAICWFFERLWQARFRGCLVWWQLVARSG